jgi:hypothetical protein
MEEKLKVDDVIKFAVDSPDIPHLYANGFISAIGNGDTLLVFQQTGRPIATLNLSFTVAKTLVKKLGAIIEDLEKNSGNTIMTTGDLDEVLRKTKKIKNGKHE